MVLFDLAGPVLALSTYPECPARFILSQLKRAGIDFPSMAELNSLIENSTARRRPFIVTAIFTGMRLSELRGLRWPDIDLEADVIHVRQRADA